MVNKRGLSPHEYDQLDLDLLEALMIYDALIEPSGTKVDMLFHAHKCYSDAILSPNMSEKFRMKLKVTDFDFLNILDKEEKEDKSKEDIKSLGEQIKQMALRKENGKK